MSAATLESETKTVPPASWKIEHDTDGSDWLWWGPEIEMQTAERTVTADICFSPDDGFSTSIMIKGGTLIESESLVGLTIEELTAVIAAASRVLAAYDSLPVEQERT